MKIACAQINTTVGALSQNTKAIKEIITQYSPKADIIVFPEMALTGYPPQDLLFEPKFIKKTEEYLQSIATCVVETPVIIGAIRKEGNQLFNTAVIFQNGKIIGYRDKTLLPTYDVFDEDRYFTPAKTIEPIKIDVNIQQVSLGIQVCEDLWDEDYSTKVTDELVSKNVDLIINISASPFSINRLTKRIDNVRDKVKHLKKHFIYCNLVGGQDELVFDGASFAVNSSGIIIGLANSFESEIIIFDTENTDKTSVTTPSEEEQIFKALTLGVRDYFAKTGHTKAVIGLSGGIDSALTAVIASNALKPENVLGVALPSEFSSDHSVADAQLLAENLSINYNVIPIKNINAEMLKSLKPVFADTEFGLAEENLQARIRGNILMAITNKKNALLLNTGNKTETALGYCTMYGDMAGALGVISDLNKTQVYAVSRWINKFYGKEIIPENTLSKPPSAELKPNQVDPFDYDLVSPLVDKIVMERKYVDELISDGYEPEIVKDMLRKIRLSEYKRRQSAPGIRISVKAFGVGRRYPVVNQFRDD
ncbi:MAG: NAD+ synthase [Candidatus Marinimicrobia bacterium]|nr:NAD+ synthase [Candidatus Neomarinimicrobiota bacterium]MBL7022680.1 NAD+ synthase [Candidatus Neomarinimicrobiota bacterium]MBL7110077.1 NAD+ synthase [Candidatus Neomarinimicrobiota bacterium]